VVGLLQICLSNSERILKISHHLAWGTGIRGLMRGMATLPQGNQELLVVKDKVGRPPGELGVNKSRECDIFPSVL